MKCLNCKSTDIKTRTNYTHGRKSSSTTAMVCRNCGSTNIEAQQVDRKKRRWQRR